jgi:hypothetical protein
MTEAVERSQSSAMKRERSALERITPDDLKRRIDAHERITIIDTRALEAWNSSQVQLPGAVRLAPMKSRSTRPILHVISSSSRTAPNSTNGRAPRWRRRSSTRDGPTCDRCSAGLTRGQEQDIRYKPSSMRCRPVLRGRTLGKGHSREPAESRGWRRIRIHAVDMPRKIRPYHGGPSGSELRDPYERNHLYAPERGVATPR